ncbi:hypothetical protein HYW74_03495 [Candidatus Pacearchaeota archaeon]|nr:hypothetical protein [Candidatus Pacearchaeota archaeon]
MSRYSSFRKHFFDNEEAFVKFFKKPRENPFVKHEIEHAIQAQKLGYQILYVIQTGRLEEWGWDVILQAGVKVLGDVLLEDMIKISSAPKNPSEGDLAIIQYCQDELKNGDKYFDSHKFLASMEALKNDHRLF